MTDSTDSWGTRRALRCRPMVAALLTAWLLLPAAQAGDNIILGATVSQTIYLGFEDLEIRYAPEGNLNGATSGDCKEDGSITAATSGRGFTFSEQNTQAGCAEARYSLAIPSNATSVQLSFAFTREVEEMNDDTTPWSFPIDAIQPVQFYNETGADWGNFVYVAGDTDRVATPELVERIVQPPAGDENFTIGWFFYERGATTLARLGLPTSNQAFSSTVSEVNITLTGMPLTGHRYQGESVLPYDEDALEADVLHYVALDVPPPVRAGGATTVEASIAPAFVLHSLYASDGAQVPASDLEYRTADGIVTIILPPEVTAAHAPGTYNLTLKSTKAIVQEEAIPGPAPIKWLPWATGAVPIVGLSLAFPALGLRRSPHFAAALAWRNMWAIVAIAAAVCIGAAAMALTRSSISLTDGSPDAMAIAVHAQWVGGGIAMIIVAIVGSRQMRRAYAAESERERREREAMERVNKELERFAYVASHDLQEPLRKVISITQLVQARYKGKLDEEADEFLGYAADSAQRMRELVQDLLRYSRIDEVAASQERISIADTVATVKADLGSLIQESDAQITLAEGAPALAGNPSQFRQVLQNLVANAIKYRKLDEAPIVHITTQPEANMTHVQVIDNGVGIAPRHQAKIFDIFQRLHSQKEVQGTGIGLSLVRKIIERHGGRVWIDSEAGAGATFHFLWPTWEAT